MGKPKEHDAETRRLIKSVHESTKRANEMLSEHLAKLGKQQMRLIAIITMRPVDLHPWKGKHRVPEILVNMLLAGKGLDCKTNKERHELLIADAVAQSGGDRSFPYSYSVWSRKLEGWALKNCRKVLMDHGYKPAPADIKLSSFVKLLKAGIPERVNSAQSGKTWGEGIHAVTFLAANEMLYRGNAYNVQWVHKGKKCGPLQGSGSALRSGERTGLWTLLKESVTRAEWPDIKQLAHDADLTRVMAAVKSKVKASHEAQLAAIDFGDEEMLPDRLT